MTKEFKRSGGRKNDKDKENKYGVKQAQY